MPIETNLRAQRPCHTQILKKLETCDLGPSEIFNQLRSGSPSSEIEELQSNSCHEDATREFRPKVELYKRSQTQHAHGGDKEMQMLKLQN